MAFDVQGARKAGYSDAEIADHLGQSSRFDVAGARKAGYSDAEIVGHLTGTQSTAPQPKSQAPAPKPTMTQNVTGFMANVNRHLGVGDELAAAGNTAVNVLSGAAPIGNVGGEFQNQLARQRAMEAGYQQAHPHMAALAKGTGDAALVAIPGGKTANMLARGNMAVNAARGATTAGLTAAGYAAADAGTPQERAAAAARAARDPVTLATGAVLGGLTTPRTPKAAPKPMSVDQLRAAKNAAYQAADQAGVRYTPQAFADLAQDMGRQMAALKLNPMRHPKAASMLEDIQAMSGQAPTLTELDQLRQVVSRDVASAVDKSERRLGKAMIEQIDQFIGSAGPGQVSAGNAQDVAELITKARDLNTRLRKVEDVSGAVRSAELRAGSTGSGGNADNAIRQNLRRVLEKGKNFTDEESKALESIVMGGKGQNLLRLVGKFSPSGNGLMAAGNLGAAALAGPIGAIPGAAGIVSKLAADNMTRQKVEALVRTMANGGQKLRPVATGPAASRLSPEVAAKLSRAGAIAGGQRAAPADYQPNALALGYRGR